MAVLDTFRSTPAAITRGSFSRIVLNSFAHLKDWNDARQTRNTLGKLSARELEDIGLVPGDIDEIARRAGR